MLKSSSVSIIVTSAYLLVYLVLISIGRFENIVWVMFLFSPVLVIWMVYTILKYGKYSGPTLDNDEWGYEDRRKEDMDVF